MSLIGEVKKLLRCVHLWRKYVDYRREKKTISTVAQRHYNRALLRSVFTAHDVLLI